MTPKPLLVELKPLGECIKHINPKVITNYDDADVSRLTDIIFDCDSKLFIETRDSDRVDTFRAVSWFANAALTRKGVAPRARECLGAVPVKIERLLHQVRKQDAPYIDLQWLAHRCPTAFPKRWADARYLMSTAPGRAKAATIDPDECFVLEPVESMSIVDRAFDAADRLVGRQDSTADKCRALKLTPAHQSQLRWLCSRSASQLLAEIEQKEAALRKQMRTAGIRQLTEDLINQRLLIFRAWKLAGGGSRWQDAANVFELLTGRSITRQAVRDMITRMSEQKLVRRHRHRTKMAQPLISEE